MTFVRTMAQNAFAVELELIAASSSESKECLLSISISLSLGLVSLLAKYEYSTTQLLARFPVF